MELIDIVDEFGNFTGEVVEKEVAHDRNLLHNEVAAFIINDKKQVLLQKRSASKRFNPNKWALCAGHVDTGEDLKAAALREIKEEIGVDVAPNNLKSFSEREFTLEDTNSHITYFYYVKLNLPIEDFKIQTEELSEIRWFDIEEVIKMIKNNDKTTVFTNKRLHLFEELKEVDIDYCRD